MIALLWGTPIALAFGLSAALVTSVGGMVIAALGAWYGGLIDRGLQFLTEVNLILPFFPVALMIFTLYLAEHCHHPGRGDRFVPLRQRGENFPGNLPAAAWGAIY